MRVPSFQELTLIEAIFKEHDNPLLIRLLERMINFSKLRVNTVQLIQYVYRHNENIMKRIPDEYLKDVKDILYDAVFGKKDILIRMLESLVDYDELDEGRIWSIWCCYEHNEKIMTKIPRKYLKDGWWYDVCDVCRLTKSTICEPCDMCGLCTLSGDCVCGVCRCGHGYAYYNLYDDDVPEYVCFDCCHSNYFYDEDDEEDNECL